MLKKRSKFQGNSQKSNSKEPQIKAGATENIQNEFLIKHTHLHRLRTFYSLHISDSPKPQFWVRSKSKPKPKNIPIEFLLLCIGLGL